MITGKQIKYANYLDLSLEVLDLTMKYGDDENDESRDQIYDEIRHGRSCPSDGKPERPCMYMRSGDTVMETELDYEEWCDEDTSADDCDQSCTDGTSEAHEKAINLPASASLPLCFEVLATNSVILSLPVELV